jgi:hypothetical protein
MSTGLAVASIVVLAMAILVMGFSRLASRRNTGDLLLAVIGALLVAAVALGFASGHWAGRVAAILGLVPIIWFAVAAVARRRRTDHALTTFREARVLPPLPALAEGGNTEGTA